MPEGLNNAVRVWICSNGITLDASASLRFTKEAIVARGGFYAVRGTTTGRSRRRYEKVSFLVKNNGSKKQKNHLCARYPTRLML